MKHGDLVNFLGSDPRYNCEKCGFVHSPELPGCDGLRGPPPTAETMWQWREARGVNTNPIEMIKPPSALGHQEGGDHYKALKIQPIEYIHANGIPFAEGSVIKYVTRWRAKNGVADLKKARHFLDLLIELEEKARV